MDKRIDSAKDIRELIESTANVQMSDEMKLKIFELYTQFELERERKANGLMGKIFGNHSEHVARYIAFFVTVILVIVGFVYILIPAEYKQATNAEFWQIIGPIITGALGYIFGSGNAK